MRFVYPVLMDGRILTICGNDIRGYRAMARAAAGFGGTASRPAVQPRPDGHKRGNGEAVVTMDVTRDGATFKFRVERWLVASDRYGLAGKGRVSTL